MEYQKLVNNSFLFRIFLLAKLPLAFIAGIRVQTFTREKAIVKIRYKWLTQNPFRSMYFACQAMAAEMSTGLLVMNHTYKSSPAVSMLIVKNSAEYYKKAVGRITFECNEGNKIQQIIEQVKNSDEGMIIELTSTGRDEKGDKVSEFIFTWSLKKKL